jgi:N-acetylglucosaminylphosphatidylinositol deacetylase
MTTIAIFVIAHPDDESMFFLPTIFGLQHVDQKWLLCLSNGNYNGLGRTREVELHRAAGCLGFDRIVVVNHDELQDSPTRTWSHHTVARVLEETLLRSLPNPPDADANDCHPHQQVVLLYTFDDKGVSGHVNHVDTHHGVQLYLQNRDQTQNVHIRGFQLITEQSLRRKYVPLLHWLVLLGTLIGILTKTPTPTTTTPQSTPTDSTYFTLYRPWLNWKCMAAHASQFVWYRRLFVVFSCYTYENRWLPIHTAKQGTSLDVPEHPRR